MGSGAAAAVNSSHTPILDDGSTVSTRATSTQITAEIARFYNNFERECEADSYVYHMKRFNNFVKSVLIDQAVEDAGRGRKRRGHPGERASNAYSILSSLTEQNVYLLPRCRRPIACTRPGMWERGGSGQMD